MRLAVIDDRIGILTGETFVDIHEASKGAFGPTAESVFAAWPKFRAWAGANQGGGTGKALSAQVAYGPPSPRPRQVFGIGVNYADHAGEADMKIPDAPLVFTKFPSCIAGQSEPLHIPVDTDWEVELVVVLGTTARNVSRADAWAQIAGVTVGQDFSDRTLQFQGTHPQFNLCKSRPGYGAIGPWLVTPDELPSRDDLDIRCTIDGETVQHSRTKHLIHDVSALVSYLSTIVTLFPGDVIFTGTPAGVGFARNPKRFLKVGETVLSTIEGIGSLETRVVA